MIVRPLFLISLFILLLSSACSLSRHPVELAELGTPRSAAEMEALLGQPGPVRVETVVAADWQVALSGLLNLDHPKAQAAGLSDRPEPIQVYFHALRHPTKGLFIVDTGVEKALRDDPEKAAIRGIVASVMNMEALQVHHDTASWIAKQEIPLAGVFMTHLHLDHVSGLADVPATTPVYAGPGETTTRSVEHVVVQPNIDRTLEGKAPIREWPFVAETDAAFEAVLDIFGDGSVFALHVPGHTPGSTAYLARTPEGPVLLVGDASHTAWGWEQGVEPGTFSGDQPRSAENLARLKALVARHPAVDVRLGHQAMTPNRAAAAATR